MRVISSSSENVSDINPSYYVITYYDLEGKILQCNLQKIYPIFSAEIFA